MKEFKTKDTIDSVNLELTYPYKYESEVLSYIGNWKATSALNITVRVLPMQEYNQGMISLVLTKKNQESDEETS